MIVQTVHDVGINVPAGTKYPYETVDIYIDENECAFYKGSIHIEKDERMAVVMLTAGQVEVICKVLGVVQDE